MTSRYIRTDDRLAAALACLLPQQDRDQLRADKAPSTAVISLFDFHHIIFHAHGGPNLWWNLHPMIKAEHRERTAKIDVPAIAKGKRIARANPEAVRRLLAKEPRSARPVSRWPKRKFGQR